MTQTIITALDLFAGTGWGVACQRLGISETGVEIMPEAIETREANGMHTLYNDVWDGLQNPSTLAEFYRWCADSNSGQGFYDLLIASPPCQTFSMAGQGSGRKALDEVIEAIETHAYKDPQALREFGEKHDMRTALVLTPLAHVWRDRPRLVALEQVPTVLPVWEACAEIMRDMGYDVKTAILNAEQYGVPQTRRRAILVARLDGEVSLPKPTHSRYYSTNPDKLDPGVAKWVSMAEALGWTPDGTAYTGNNKLANQSVRTLDKPAPTVTAGHDSGNRGFISPEGDFTKATVEQVSALQSYPAALRSNYGTGGDSSKRGQRTIHQPSPTLTSKADRNKWDGEQNMTVDQAAALQTYPTGWGFTNRPAVTVGNAVGRGLIGGSGAKQTVVNAIEDGTFIPSIHGKSDAYAEQTRITVAEAGVLQTYDRPFEWRGSKTKQFLQIGNAVPPLLAQAVLSALTEIPTP